MHPLASSGSSTLLALGRLRPALISLAAAPSPSSVLPEKQGKAEHLIWDPGFGIKLALSLAGCGVFAWVAAESSEAWILGMQLQSGVSLRLMQLAHRLEWWSALGLLSSSCCVLQLMLNSLSIGCAASSSVLT